MPKLIRKKVLVFLKAFVLLGIASSSMAEENQTSLNNNLKPISNVRVSMQRMVKSSEGRYFLSLYAGIPNPHAVLYDLVSNTEMNLKGTQKGDQLNLRSVNTEDAEAGVGNSTKKIQLSGTLNANTGVMKALLSEQMDTLGTSVQFEPAFKVENKPVFIFKFYGQNEGSAYGETLKRVDVLNKNNNTVVQSLTGFSAYSKSVGYLDINFDGYYDVILSDISQGKKVEDKRYIYWMYNPKTQQFQRSSQLDKIIGFPSLHGEKQQIDFGNGQVYQVEKGLLKRLASEN